MNAKERRKFQNALANAQFEAIKKAEKICAEITLPLEIEALKFMLEGLQSVLELKERRYQSIINQKNE